MSQRKVIWEAVENEDHSYYPYIRHVVSDVDPKVMKTLVTNFFINASLVGWPKQEKLRAELNCNISIKRSGGMKQGICGLFAAFGCAVPIRFLRSETIFSIL